MGQSNNLSEGAKINGWPLLDNLKGKFIICLTGNSKDKKKYATTLPRTRLCFADKDTDPNQIPEDPDRVFFNFHIYHNKRKYWIKVFKECAKKSNVIIRAYVANSEDNWKDCLDSGCNLIATDRISNHKWAKVGRYGWDTRFTRLKPLDK